MSLTARTGTLAPSTQLENVKMPKRQSTQSSGCRFCCARFTAKQRPSARNDPIDRRWAGARSVPFDCGGVNTISVGRPASRRHPYVLATAVPCGDPSLDCSMGLRRGVGFMISSGNSRSSCASRSMLKRGVPRSRSAQSRASSFGGDRSLVVWREVCTLTLSSSRKLGSLRLRC